MCPVLSKTGGADINCGTSYRVIDAASICVAKIAVKSGQATRIAGSRLSCQAIRGYYMCITIVNNAADNRGITAVNGADTAARDKVDVSAPAGITAGGRAKIGVVATVAAVAAVAGQP